MAKKKKTAGINRQFTWTIRFTLLTVPALIIALLFMGAGHGTWIPATWLFPYGMIGTLFIDRVATPFIILAILQYPVYGFLIDRTGKKKKQRRRLYWIPVIHVVLAALIIIAGKV